MSWPASASRTRTASGSVKAAPSGGACALEVADAGLDGAAAVARAVAALLESRALTGWPAVVLEHAVSAATASPTVVAFVQTVRRMRRFDHAALGCAP